jgi:DNA-binding GntR family transcriptional regulator
MSNHLARLRSERLVDFTRYHRSLVYELTTDEVRQIIAALHQIYCADDDENSQ